MTNNNRLLVPVDFSQSDDKSIQFAQTLAQKNNLLIDLIHVIYSSEIPVKNNQNDSNSPGINSDLVKEGQVRIKTIMTKNISENHRGNYYLKSAPYPSVAINSHASEGKYSMIIMTKKSDDPSGIFSSSTTEQVLRRTKVPVMILDEKTDIKAIKSILVPTDGSLLSMTAIPAAIELAQIFNGRITMLYVDEVYGLLSNHFSTKSSLNVKREVIQYLLTRLREYFKSYDINTYELIESENYKEPNIKFGPEDKHTIPLRMKIVTGLSAHHEITKYAKRCSDFIVMATHGRSGLVQFIMGSNAEKVALNIEKPILTIRPESKFFAQNKKIEA